MKKNNKALSIIISYTLIMCNLLMAQDFSGTHFRNGDPIPYIESNEEWKKAGENKQPAWCYYDNDPANGAKYGKLYNWYAVTDPRRLCPVGWHVPSDAEWTILTDYLGGEDAASNKLKSSYGWDFNGSNSSGFTGLPAGYRYYDGTFDDVGYYGIWWSSTEFDTFSAWYRYLGYYDDSSSKENGFSVRCVANDIIFDIKPD